MILTAQPNSPYQIQTSENNVDYTFTFGTTGTLSVPGNIEIKYLSSDYKGVLTTELITNSDKKWAFPNKSGVVALLSDVTSTGLPSQSGNAGKFLTTDGTTLSWQLIDSTGSEHNASFTAVIGDGSSKVIRIIHNLGTDAIVCSVWELLDARRSANCTISIISDNEISLSFKTAPRQNSIKVTIISSVFSNAIVNNGGGGASLPSVLGHANHYLKTDGVNITWQAIPESLPNQLNNAGKALFTTGTYAVWQNIPSPLPNQSGNNGKFLQTDGSVPSWASPFPTQTGNEGKFLSTNGTSVIWSIPNYMTNPMSTFGDLIIGGTNGAAGRLGIGSTDQILTVGSLGSPEWKSIIPTMAGNNGKVLSTDGSTTLWTVINEVPAVTGIDSGKVLSNNGTSFLWIVNTAPPDVSGQSGKYLTNNGSSTLWSAIREVPSTSTHAGKVLTNDGGSYYWTLPNNMYPNQTDNSGKVLTTNGTSVSWEFADTGFSNPMTTKGDIIVADDGGVGLRLARGTTGQILVVQSNGTLAWETSTALTNPMTSTGDLVIGASGGSPNRLAVGGNGTFLGSNGSTPQWISGAIAPSVAGHSGQWLTNNGTTTAWADLTTIPDQTGNNGKYLTTNGTIPSWSTIPSGFANPMTTLGDMIVAQSGGTAGRLAAGVDGQVLVVTSGSPAWTTLTGLPTQTGHNGHFLTTNATSASWTQIYQVPLATGHSGKFLGTLDGISYGWEVLPNQLPSVSGQSGKYLSNDGNTASWVPYAGLPDFNGQSGKILSTDGVTAFWIDPSGSSGTGLVRLPITVVSSTLAPSSPTAVLAGETRTISTTCYSFKIYSISVSHPCRLRIYGTNAFATADYLRNSTVDPTGNHGLYTEITFSPFQLNWVMTPIPVCFNLDSTPATDIYMNIENFDSVNRAITITLNILKLE